ncbi:hypothetical protein BD309DRAFT_88150 [Dichomitus squalens]|nr:hypothetical protein BD309DRAFT_88150 [Dichomitus squalens]
MPGQAPRTSIPARRSAPPRVRAPSSRSPPPQSLEREARTHPTSVRSPETPPFAVPLSARRAHDQIPPWPGDPRARPREHLDALPFSYRLLCSARPSTRLRLRQTACDGPAGPAVLSRTISHLTSLPDANARVRDDTSVAPGASIAIHAISRRFLFRRARQTRSDACLRPRSHLTALSSRLPAHPAPKSQRDTQT